jgi:hypothetical protein
MTSTRRLSTIAPWLAALALLAILAVPDPARACACCTQPAWRKVEVERFDGARLAEVGKVRFAKTAKLMLGEADEDGIKGVPDVEEDYSLAVARVKDRLVFSFRDAKRRAGTLTLAFPKTVSIFEVDPRDGRDEGAGPVLYKEWKLTASASGDGLFRTAVGAGQRMTLVLHGRGGGCTEVGDFSHWTLLVYGPVDTFTLYGTLESHRKQ